DLSQRPVATDQLTLLLLNVSELALMLQGGSHADPATGSITGLPRRLPPARLAQCLLLIARLLDDRHRVPEVSDEDQLVQEPEASPVLRPLADHERPVQPRVAGKVAAMHVQAHRPGRVRRDAAELPGPLADRDRRFRVE